MTAIGGREAGCLTQIGRWRKRAEKTEEGGYARKETVEGKAGSDLKFIRRIMAKGVTR